MAIFKGDVEQETKKAPSEPAAKPVPKAAEPAADALHPILVKIDALQTELGSSIGSDSPHRNATLARVRQLRKLASMALR